MSGTRLKDLWTTSPAYEVMYQGGDEVETIVRLPGEIISGLNAAGLLMRGADGWTYAHPELNERQLDLIRSQGAEKRLNLRETADGWTADLHWVRVLAEKS